jgi:hypothetical protein
VPTESHTKPPLKVTSINIEGVRNNMVYADKLFRESDIVCIQEHWLLSYDSQFLSTNPDYCSAVKCYDDSNPVAPTHRPRGYAGVALVWKKDLDHAIKVQPDGSERVQVAQIICRDSVPCTIINSYMPAEGSLDSSCTYSSILDEVYEITMKYSPHSTILWIGDLNASFTRKKKTTNDKLFSEFCEEVGYIQPPCTPNMPTYHHFTGGSSSHIDHILQLKHQEQAISRIYIDNRNAVNTSTHDSITAMLQKAPQPASSQETAPQYKTTVKKVNWKKVDLEIYTSSALEKNLISYYKL